MTTEQWHANGLLGEFAKEVVAKMGSVNDLSSSGVKYSSNFTWLLYLSVILGDFNFIQEQFNFLYLYFYLITFQYICILSYAHLIW